MNQQQSYNYADKHKNAVDQRRGQMEKQQELEDLYTVLKSKAGQRFMGRLAAKCFDGKSTYTNGNNAAMCVNEGMRNVWLLIKADIEAIGLNAFDLIQACHREVMAARMECEAKAEYEVKNQK